MRLTDGTTFDCPVTNVIDVIGVLRSVPISVNLPGNATWLYAVKIKIAVDYSDTFRSYRDRYFHFVGGLTETDWNRNDLSEIFFYERYETPSLLES